LANWKQQFELVFSRSTGNQDFRGQQETVFREFPNDQQEKVFIRVFLLVKGNNIHAGSDMAERNIKSFPIASQNRKKLIKVST
jgi:hypothetical protein